MVISCILFFFLYIYLDRQIDISVLVLEGLWLSLQISHSQKCDICQISNTLRDFLVVYLNSRMNLSEFVVSCEGHGDLTKHIFDLLCDSATGELLFVSSQHVKIPRDNPDRGHVFKSVQIWCIFVFCSILNYVLFLMIWFMQPNQGATWGNQYH